MRHNHDKYWHLDEQPNKYVQAAGMVLGLPIIMVGLYILVVCLHVIIN